MGLKSSAFIAQRVTNAVKYMCQISHVCIENYLYDFAGEITPIKHWSHFYELGKISEFYGLEEALEKPCPPSAPMIFIGVLFDTESLTLLVTHERLQEITKFVNSWLQYQTATLKQLQSLIGKLNFVAHCVKPARIFISRLLLWLLKIQNSENAQIVPDVIRKNLFATVQWCFYDGSGRMEPTRSVCSKRCMFDFLWRFFGKNFFFSFEISRCYLETKITYQCFRAPYSDGNS